MVFTLSWTPEPSGTFETRHLYDAEQFFLVPAAWTAGRGISCLEGKTLLSETESSAALALRSCRAHGFAPGRIRYVNAFLLLAAMIAHGEGFSVWSRYTPVPFTEKIVLVPFQEQADIPPTRVVATWRKEDESPALQQARGILMDSGFWMERAAEQPPGLQYKW
jgi:DNA-binding transcriptional LysR family regulator